MTRNLSYYSNLCEERTADFTDKHQKEYRLDLLKALINTLEHEQQGGTHLLADEYFMLLHDIFEFMPQHERYFATIDKDRMNLYFTKINELQNKLSVKNGYFEFIENRKKDRKKVMDIVLPVFLICNIFFDEYKILNTRLNAILFWSLVVVYVATKINDYWKEYQWRKEYVN
jgi:hypothetical protein